jgi:putative acetyltransferase
MNGGSNRIHLPDDLTTTVRLEHAADVESIRRVNVAAFGGAVEADLVDRLRERGKLLVSMVAQSGDVIVGHIGFSRVVVEARDAVRGVGLAPMSVLPALQRNGIGSALVGAGLGRCRALQYEFAVVLGHADYYPRFGFVSAGRFGLTCAWDVPDDVFMALELRAGALTGASGRVAYEPEFSEASHDP